MSDTPSAASSEPHLSDERRMPFLDHLAELRAADVLSDHVAAARGAGSVDEARSAEMVRELEHATDPDAVVLNAIEAHAPEADADDFGFVAGSPFVPDTHRSLLRLFR